MSLTRSLIPQQHRPILDQLLVRLSLRQGQGRLVTETEIAKVVARLCEPEFDFMTGRSIVLDGGRTLPRFPRLDIGSES